jgi:tetratricopeptide (TPR) repeat protein
MKTLGKEHPGTVGIFNHLGIIYGLQSDKRHKAEEMYMQALEGQRKTIGEEYVSTLATPKNLGSLYDNQGRLDEAEKTYEQVLDGYNKLLGPEGILGYEPALDAALLLAIVYGKQGRNKLAIVGCRIVLPGYEKVLGEDHARCQEIRDLLGRATRRTEQQNPTSILQRVLERLG